MQEACRTCLVTWMIHCDNMNYCDEAGLDFTSLRINNEWMGTSLDFNMPLQLFVSW